MFGDWGRYFDEDEGISMAGSRFFVDSEFEGCLPCSAIEGRDVIVNGSTTFGPGATVGCSSFSEGRVFPDG